jgi:hypothetical protein
MSEEGKKPVIAEGKVGVGASAQGVVTVIDSLNQGYTQLSGTFTDDQKRVADAVNFAPNLQTLERVALRSIAETGKQQVDLLKEQNKLLQEQNADEKKSVRNANMIAVSAIIVAIIIAIVSWILRA